MLTISRLANVGKHAEILQGIRTFATTSGVAIHEKGTNHRPGELSYAPSPHLCQIQDLSEHSALLRYHGECWRARQKRIDCL